MSEASDRLVDRRWAGKPVYVCRWCPFERVQHADRVDAHEREAHPEQFHPSAPVVRESLLVLGPDGRPATVVVDAGPEEHRPCRMP